MKAKTARIRNGGKAMAVSKFASLFDKRQARPVGETVNPPEQASAPAQAAAEPRTRQAKASETVIPSEPPAKRSNPDYAQVKVFLPKTLHRRLKQAALSRETELSELVERAVLEYLSTRVPKIYLES